jgi:sugar phosphate isomerase/epimerase
MIGIGSPAFCFMPFARMLDDISKEFELWEILSEGEDRLQLIEGTFRDLQKSYSMRFQAHAPLSDVNIGSLLEPMRAAAVNEVKQTIVMCRKLEIPMVTMHPGFVHGIAFVDRKKAVLKTRESITEIASYQRGEHARKRERHVHSSQGTP